FANNRYFVVRDLWHPDSTWLLNKDSVFAVYLKPGDAKFLYFEPGIAIDAAARTGTDTGKSTVIGRCFNNGRSVAEIEHGTEDVITYTRNDHVFAASPAAGFTFGGSPDASSGDNLITGNEVLIDSVDTSCARPSLSVAQNDTGVVITWWYQTGSHGNIAASCRRKPGDPWLTVKYSGVQMFDDTSFDHKWSTPVITPIDDTTWLIAAGCHAPSISPTGIFGVRLVTPTTGSPYFLSWFPFLMASDGGPDTMSYAAMQTLSSRGLVDSLWPVRFAYQQESAPGHRDIFFRRWANLTVPIPVCDPSMFSPAVNVSEGLGDCDNAHPSLATNGTIEPIHWLIPGASLSGFGTFIHDNLAWDAQTLVPEGICPVIRTRHELISPPKHPGFWGAYSIFPGESPFRYYYPQVSAEFRNYNGQFAFPSDSSHDWLRVAMAVSGMMTVECWDPNWLQFTISEPGNNPYLAQATNNPASWLDSGFVPRSMNWIMTGSMNEPVRVTNGFLPRISHTVRQRVLLEPSAKYCDTLIEIDTKVNITIKPSGGSPTTANWEPISVTAADPDESWYNPEMIPDASKTDAFSINPCDSILVPRTSTLGMLTAMQDSLKSGSDYVMFRLKLLRKADSSWLGTIDSMIVTQSVIHWAGSTFGIDPNVARYQYPCTASPDSAFVTMEVLRGDTTNSIRRYYVSNLDTVPPVPAMKETGQSNTIPMVNDLAVTVHPNPVKGTVRICVQDIPEGVPTVVDVVNELGVEIAKLYQAVPDAECGLCLSLDCAQLPDGTYYANLQTEGMQKAVKFTVEH
ncbi:MAG TPA: hypothetical protein VGM92_09130, partial [Candidatus Kapabacteria bacterium]